MRRKRLFLVVALPLTVGVLWLAICALIAGREHRLKRERVEAWERRLAEFSQGKDLKEEARYYFSVDCATGEWFHMAAVEKQMSEAGPRLYPVLVELVQDPTTSVWLVGSVGSYAASHLENSPALVKAMRRRREDKGFGRDNGALLGVFGFFAQFGDSADLTWMDQRVRTMEHFRRSYASEHIKELARRLAARDQDSDEGGRRGR